MNEDGRMKMEEEINNGIFLPVMEEFYSLQGEGYHTGSAAYFIRIGGCDNGCYWCDIKESWDAGKFPPVSVDDVIDRALKNPSGIIVITGGEPMNYNLTYLTQQLHKHNFGIHVETAGTAPKIGTFDWICLSPKKQHPPLHEYYDFAHELKIIIQKPQDFLWAEECAAKVSSVCKLFLQPEWSRFSEILPEIVEYIKLNPQWSASLQSHKFMRIP